MKEFSALVHTAAELDIVPELINGRLAKAISNELGVDSRTLWSTENVMLVPTVSPMVSGHCIVFARSAFTNMLSFRRSSSDVQADLGFAQTLYEKTFGAAILFEHGLPHDSSTNCGVSRAHEHLVPRSEIDGRDLATRISNELGQPQLMSVDEYRRFESKLPYLSLQGVAPEVLLWAQVDIPSQTVRRAMAGQLGLHVWDWKLLTRCDLMLRTINQWHHSARINRDPV